MKDSDYNAYNTLACVGNLKKAMKEGDMMSEEEILKLQQNTQDSNMEGVARPPNAGCAPNDASTRNKFVTQNLARLQPGEVLCYAAASNGVFQPNILRG